MCGEKGKYPKRTITWRLVSLGGKAEYIKWKENEADVGKNCEEAIKFDLGVWVMLTVKKTTTGKSRLVKGGIHTIKGENFTQPQQGNPPSWGKTRIAGEAKLLRNHLKQQKLRDDRRAALDAMSEDEKEERKKNIEERKKNKANFEKEVKDIIRARIPRHIFLREMSTYCANPKKYDWTTLKKWKASHEEPADKPAGGQEDGQKDEQPSGEPENKPANSTSSNFGPRRSNKSRGFAAQSPPRRRMEWDWE